LSTGFNSQQNRSKQKQLQAMTDRDKQWNMQYEKLVEFKRTKGHCMVKQGYEQDKSLGLWVHAQRSYHKHNKLRQDRKRSLDEIGFAWKVEDARNIDDKLWNQQYEKLVAFQRKSGHCKVPSKYEQDKSLGNWVERQRRNNRNNKLRPDRKELLDKLNFAWKATGTLAARASTTDASDGFFHNQRKHHNHDNMRQDRKRILDDMGFISNAQDESRESLWNEQYERLVEFRRKKGHCMVSQRNKEHKSLGMWVRTQRKNHTTNVMLPDRKERLDALDFVWNVNARAVRSCASNMDVRGLGVGLFHFTLWADHVSNSRSFSSLLV
jgi:hypothetical protein